MSNCGLCGDPMPAGEEMFNYHGYSGSCPKPFLKLKESLEMKVEMICISVNFDPKSGMYSVFLRTEDSCSSATLLCKELKWNPGQTYVVVME